MDTTRALLRLRMCWSEKDAAGQPIAQAVALAFGGVWWFCAAG